MPEEKTPEGVNFPPHCRLMREPVSAGDHLKRVLDEYGELGFECLLKELDAEAEAGCTECFKSGGGRLYRLYVRPID
jgi:hypothetical protein